MKNIPFSRIFLCKRSNLGWLVCLVCLPALALIGLCSLPARGAVATIAPKYITTDTTWTEAGSPYLIESFTIVNPGVTLTIEAGVEVNGNYANGYNYLFEVDGTLIAQGTAGKQILFKNTLGNSQWSGININGTADNTNQGSVLEYVTMDGGGLVGSGDGANLILQYSQVDVHHCLFINSPGDGILGDDATAGGVANVYDSSFTGNAGFAINFENGAVNPVLSNLTASGNGSALGYNGNLVNVNDATLHGAHTWENMGLPYLILGTNVATDSNLIIEPGVQVLSYPGNDNLDVQGFLLAEGTSSLGITFEPLTPTLGWSGIAIMGTEELPGAGGDFDRVLITKGGFGGNCNVYIEYGNVTITNSRLDSSEDSGVCLDHGASLVMTNTLLTGNQEFAIDVYDAGALFFLDQLTPFMNHSNTIGIQGGTMVGPHTWSKSGINTYDLFYGAVTVAPTGTLNIEPGVTVQFGSTRDITVRGVLNAIGTATESINFTGETPTPGLWAGLSFIGTAGQHAVGQLAYTTIEYGGYGGSAMVYIENADVTFTHCVLRYCSGDAIEIQPGKAVAAQTVHLDWSRLNDIGGYAIQNNSSQAIPAHYNWWGAASGPTAADNPGGTGSSLLGPVRYWPFLTTIEARFVFLPMTRK